MMIKHVVYVASLSQSDKIRKAVSRLKGRAIDDRSSIGAGWEIIHPLLPGITLHLHLLTNINAVTPHLRQNPVDLLIYDERGNDGKLAEEALEQIRRDVASFAELWGPDFIFPMSRVVAIIEGDGAGKSKQPSSARAFQLGRVAVQDVCVAPRSTAFVLDWLHGLLTSKEAPNRRIGVAMSGGGMEGFLYQLGVVYALERCITGRTIRDADVYSGISSGSLACCLLAGGISTLEVIKALHGKSKIIDPFTSGTVFDLAGAGIITRLLRESFTWSGIDPTRWIEQTLKAIPTGFFKGEALRKYIRHCFEVSGKEDNFKSVASELYIGATDMDTFEHVVFGRAPLNDLPISEAIYASCALPLIFEPAKINGRYLIDGQITKSCNLELVVERDCKLIFIVDPMKPLGTLIPGSVDKKGGYYALIQTIKALVSTRFHSVLSHLTERYPTTDFIVFQPDEEVAHMMAGSPMRYRIRTQVIHLAYKQTIRQLRERHKVYLAKLQKYDMKLLSIDEIKEIEREDNDLFRSFAQS
jgi:predicted acylesterase/phospholipase RssA